MQQDWSRRRTVDEGGGILGGWKPSENNNNNKLMRHGGNHNHNHRRGNVQGENVHKGGHRKCPLQTSPHNKKVILFMSEDKRTCRRLRTAHPPESQTTDCSQRGCAERAHWSVHLRLLPRSSWTSRKQEVVVPNGPCHRPVPPLGEQSRRTVEEDQEAHTP